MKMKRWLGMIVLAAWLSVSSAHAQQPANHAAYPPPSPLSTNGLPDPPIEAFTAHPSGLSDWITYRRDCCEGKHGRITPLSTELYVFAGPTTPFGSMTLSRELTTGWSIGGGGRALFYNEPQTRAWVVDAHIINTNQWSSKRDTQFPVTIFRAGDKQVFGADGVPGVTVQSANRTMAGLGVGQEFYPWKPADYEGRKWRVGYDLGGRYGSLILTLNETRGIKDVAGGIYVGGHSKFECPWRNVMFHMGVRFEWSYTWSDVLQRSSDVQDISVLLSTGMRY